MEVVRTPDERFDDLPGYDFEPHYVEVDDSDGSTLRIHYVDEGGADAPTVLLMHGEPSWSYLYRKMIPILVEAGLRAVAPDLPGFGRSDKPTRQDDYTYQRFVEWMTRFVDTVDLRDTTLVCQDWGGLIGLRLVADQPDRFSRVVTANTFLPTGDRDPGDAFRAWQKFSQEIPDFEVGKIVSGGCVTQLAPEVIAAYDAPFPDDTFKAGARRFPMLVPTSPDDPAAAPNRQAWEVLSAWEKPWLTAFSDQDPITGGAERLFQSTVPGARDQPHTTIEGGGHFLQEDRGEALAEAVVAFVQST